LNALSESYERLRKDVSGDKAVESARSVYQLKAAETAEGAILLGRKEVARSALPALSAPQSGGDARHSANYFYAGADREQQSAPQSRFIGGKSFFQNEDQWIDSEVQKNPNAKRVRVQFNSPEYFELISKKPKLVAWLSQGRKVQFVSDGIVYEVYE
jgi:hypothetical protein